MLTVVTGPPCSGKSTYARSHAAPSDVILDFDVLAQSLGSANSHDHPPAIAAIAPTLWNAGVSRLCASHHGLNAWIVDASPTRQRKALYDRSGAVYVPLTAPHNELHARASADFRPYWTHALIDRYLDAAEAAA